MALRDGEHGTFETVRAFAHRYTLARPEEYVVIADDYLYCPPKLYFGYSPDGWRLSEEARRFVNPLEVWRGGKIVSEDPIYL